MSDYVKIDVEACMRRFIAGRVAEIGSDPAGWDRQRTEAEHEEFMKVSNHELSIERLECGSPSRGAAHADTEI